MPSDQSGSRRAAAPLVALLATLLVALPGTAAGQDASDGLDVPGALAGLDAENARAWVAPFTRALAPALTAGFFTSGGRGSAFGLSVRVNAGLVPEGDRAFTPVLPPTVTFRGESYDDPWRLSSARGTSPTVAGEGEGAIVTPRPGSAFEEALVEAGVPADARSHRLPAGLDLTRAPMPVVEASLGLRGLGLQLVGRFSPTLELFDELGDVSAFGGGVLVTVSRFLPVRVVDVGVSATTQKLDAGDWLDASASAFGVVVSRDVGPVRPYLHGTVASSSLEVAYTVSNPSGHPFLPADDTAVHLESSAGGQTRLAVGAVLRLPVLELAGEYQPGSRDVLSVRLGLRRP